LAKPNHPWTNGQVERMNRTIKDATVKRYHYDSHDQRVRHLDDFVAAYNFARRLKTLNGLTPFEFVCKRWTTEPERFRLNPLQQNAGTKQLVKAVRLRAQLASPPQLMRAQPAQLWALFPCCHASRASQPEAVDSASQSPGAVPVPNIPPMACLRSDAAGSSACWARTTPLPTACVG